MTEDDKEDEKENNINEKQAMEIGVSMMDKLMNNNGFNNMMSECVKNMDFGQLISNLANNPQIKELNNTISAIHPEFKDLKPTTPEEIEKFKDKDNNIDLKSLFNHNLEKMGCQNLQDMFSKYGDIALNSPLFNIIENEFQNLEEKCENNMEEIMNKNKDKMNEVNFNNIFNEVMNEKFNNNS